MNKKAQGIKRLKADRALEMYKQGAKLDVLVYSLSVREWKLFLELLGSWLVSRES